MVLWDMGGGLLAASSAVTASRASDLRAPTCTRLSGSLSKMGLRPLKPL